MGEPACVRAIKWHADGLHRDRYVPQKARSACAPSTAWEKIMQHSLSHQGALKRLLGGVHLSDCFAVRNAWKSARRFPFLLSYTPRTSRNCVYVFDARFGASLKCFGAALPQTHMRRRRHWMAGWDGGDACMHG